MVSKNNKTELPTEETLARGKRIAEAEKHWKRQQVDRTVKQLVGIIGISEPAYYAWKNGTADQIKAEYFMRFCEATGFSPLYLYTGHGGKMNLDDPRLDALLRTLDGLSDADFDEVLQYADDRKNRHKRRSDPETDRTDPSPT